MADGKRYYWLKLYDDFFGSIRIKKLRRMAGGDTYVIIYLKLQLKAMKTDGVLKWKGYEQDFVEELALDLDEEPDDVRVTLMYLLSCGLAETQDNVNFFFPYSVENVGSEGASAQRVREYRERQASVVPQLPKHEPKTNAERQRAFRAKQNTAKHQHIPMIEDYMNQKRYGGNYYIVCQRERFKCAICESTENLCVHHIDGYDESKPENNAANKMILLCRSCHSTVHAGTPIPQENLDAIGYDSNDETVTGDAPVTGVTEIGNGEIDTRDKIQDTRDRDKKSAARADLSPLEKAMDDFTKHRKAMKKPLTDRARELILMDLERLAPNDPETQIAIINQSIKRGWQGVFPLKDDSPKPAAPKNGPPMKTQYDKTYAEPIDDDLDKLAAMMGVDV